jgi:putative endonuclease
MAGRLGTHVEVVAPATNVARGATAEAVAATLLARAGYRVVERNYRCVVGELDIVAYDGEVLTFVEVRSRRDDRHGEGAEMVGKRKQRQVARVAGVYLALRAPAAEQVRFDVVALTGDDAVLIKDAWRV